MRQILVENSFNFSNRFGIELCVVIQIDTSSDSAQRAQIQGH